MALALAAGCGGDDDGGGRGDGGAGDDGGGGNADAGQVCGGLAGDPCPADLFCCHPDPRIADDLGMCTDKANLRDMGQECGVTSGACCAENLSCSINDSTGDGVCR